ncbi:MAG: cytochrome b/b6 domain-containing protein [Steroidobacteraceae bacterium]
MSEKRLVWDLPLRLFHWVLVLSIAASWYTAENSEEYISYGDNVISYTQIHFWLGYWALGLIIFRVIWGFVGPRHARFSHFLKGPGTVLGYAGKFLKRDSPPSIGHNPMGAWMVVLMLASIAAQAITGLFLLDNTEIYPAPFNPSVEPSTASKLGSFHHFNFNVLLWLIGLHVVAIVFYVFYKRQNLIGPMLTGRKHADLVPTEHGINGSQLIKALIVALVAGGAVWLLLEQAPPPPTFEEY